jgi:signal transduction histidine kinase
MGAPQAQTVAALHPFPERARTAGTTEAAAAARDVDRRVAGITDGFDPKTVVAALTAGRAAVLSRWLDITARQPFHADRPDHAVADHIPELFDATVALLSRSGIETDGWSDAPSDDPAITEAATAHAQVRFEQGLGPVAVVTEFRLLRLEISRALSALLHDDVPASDVVASMALVSDALDGAATVGLAALSGRIESLRESFLATTLHDVRQPITLVNGSLHLASRWLVGPEVDPERLRVAVDDALSATTELMAMIDTMSDASRVAVGELDHDPEPASLEEIVRSSLAAFGESARQRVHLLAPEGRHLIGLWDAQLLHRVVANLVNNALKYSDGPITVEVGHGRPGMARLTVSDHGLGMTEEELREVFERFSRAERVRSQGIPGLGLGLYACRGIVVAHGGTIELRSDGQGQGTTVIVELPLISDEDEADPG